MLLRWVVTLPENSLHKKNASINLSMSPALPIIANLTMPVEIESVPLPVPPPGGSAFNEPSPDIELIAFIPGCPP
ncbi:hypothetical protein CEXT_202851 [Caerostris extrusa]|uniref:Uncharacterized protein n=1 Tax=Caerostris extrusa TaxID=172846 RepID=A0AAV4UQB8_CAEEX|nr:hypothetical protein CEXT_202851 [Caerostris extrusa]